MPPVRAAHAAAPGGRTGLNRVYPADERKRGAALGVHLVGPPRETMAYATDMRSYVADKTGRDIALWSPMFGAPIGTLFWCANPSVRCLVEVDECQAVSRGVRAEAMILRHITAHAR